MISSHFYSNLMFTFQSLFLPTCRANMLSTLRLLTTERNTTGVATDDPDKPIAMPNPYEKDKQVCILCKINIDPDYKNVRMLSQFQSPYTGRIYGRHITGLCKKRQAQVELAIARANSAGLMPVYHKIVEFTNDPKLFNAERPIRGHKY